MATELNFDIRSGDDLVLECTMTEDGAPASLVGASLKWGFSRLRSDGTHSATPAVEKTIGDGIAVVDAAAGRYDVSIDSADTDGRKGDWYHECEVMDADGKRSTVLYGVMTVDRDLVDN